MKTLLLILLSLLLISCGAAENNKDQEPLPKKDPPIVTVDEPDATPDTEPPEVIIVVPVYVDPTSDTVPTPEVAPDPIQDPTPDVLPIIAPIIAPVKFTVKIDNSLYFYRGENLELWKTGKINKSGPYSFSVGNLLYTFDATGNEIATAQLDSTPDAILKTDLATYHCTEYPPALALSMGGRYRIYSEFYKDNNIISPWYLNQRPCGKFSNVGTEIFSANKAGTIRTIDGVSSLVFNVLDGVFYNHSLSMGAKTFYFNDSIIVYGLNSAFNNHQWINYNGLNYSGNGYTWGELESLIPAATVLTEFTTPYYFGTWLPAQERPVLLAVGSVGNKLYWIECNSGDLLEYDPVNNTLIKKWSLYLGDGLKNSGQAKQKVLNPFVFEGVLYYNEGGAINKIDLQTGFGGVFYGGLGNIMGF